MLKDYLASLMKELSLSEEELQKITKVVYTIRSNDQLLQDFCSSDPQSLLHVTQLSQTDTSDTFFDDDLELTEEHPKEMPNLYDTCFPRSRGTTMGVERALVTPFLSRPPT